MDLLKRNKRKILELIEEFKNSKIYGPSDDPDSQTAMIIGHNDLVVKLKYYTRKIEDYYFKNEIQALEEQLETVYEVYDLRSRLEPLLDDLEEEVGGSLPSEQAVRCIPKLKPMERVKLIEEIGLNLRDNMTTSDINVFMSGYEIDFEPEEVATSKRLYIKEILTKEPERIIVRIARDLGIYKDDLIIEIGKIDSVDNTYVKEQVSKCNDKILSGDFDGAITNARTLVESVCMYVLEDSQIEYKKDGNLIKLYKCVSEYLNMKPVLYESDSLKQITSGFFSIIQGLAGLRNELSDAHGKDRKSYKPQERHARLAVNAAHTVSDYLLESYLKSKC